jgi:hypothetical protein
MTGPSQGGRVLPCLLPVARSRSRGLCLRGGAASSEELEDDLMGGFAPALSDREVRRVSRAAAIEDLKMEEAAAAEAAMQLEAPGGDTHALSGWNPGSVRDFRAGIMKIDAGGKYLRPLPDKGVLFLEASESDGYMHLLWKRREATSNLRGSETAPAAFQNGTKELDLLLLPDETRVERVLEFNGHRVTAARVYCVSYPDGDAFYFWMQEPSLELDDVLFNRIQHALRPPVYSPDAPDQGWTWESHLLLSASLGLHLRYSVYLLYWYESTNTASSGRGSHTCSCQRRSACTSGTHFAGFTSTKAQILTPEELRLQLQVLSVLVLKYKY